MLTKILGDMGTERRNGVREERFAMTLSDRSPSDEESNSGLVGLSGFHDHDDELARNISTSRVDFYREQRGAHVVDSSHSEPETCCCCLFFSGWNGRGEKEEVRNDLQNDERILFLPEPQNIFTRHPTRRDNDMRAHGQEP